MTQSKILHSKNEALEYLQKQRDNLYAERESIPRKSPKRQELQEAHSFYNYLRIRVENNKIAYPIIINKLPSENGTNPDYQVGDSRIEVTRATCSEHEERLTAHEASTSSRDPIILDYIISREAEQDLAKEVCNIIRKKDQKPYAKTSTLLIDLTPKTPFGREDLDYCISLILKEQVKSDFKEIYLLYQNTLYHIVNGSLHEILEA